VENLAVTKFATSRSRKTLAVTSEKLTK